MSGKTRTQAPARVQYEAERQALVRAVDGALAQGLSQEEIMALVEDRVDVQVEGGDAARVYTSLPPGLIDLPSAAEKYRVNPPTLRMLIARGRLQSHGRLKGSARGGGFHLLLEAAVRDYAEGPKSKGGRPKLTVATD